MGRFGIMSADLEQRVAESYLSSLTDALLLAGDERVPAGGPAEVQQLATSFNVMAAAVEDAERRRQELIGDVAHEMRTPIATLEGYLEGLLDGVIDPSHQLSVVSRATAPAAIVQPAVERLDADVAERGLRLDVEVPPGLPEVQADPERAIQVLTNLITNAVRYTPSPGQIAVRVASSDGVVRFEVADTGIGIAPEELPRVFERFYRIDKSRSRALGGAGVGLTIARALVETMGGRIWARSAGPGQGSTFAFELPTAAA
jgi:signal transduction histidine kinase